MPCLTIQVSQTTHTTTNPTPNSYYLASDHIPNVLPHSVAAVAASLDLNPVLPCQDTMMTVDTDEPSVSPAWLSQMLCSSTEVLVLDCRPHNEYNLSHVSGSVHVTIPSLMVKRLRNGSLAIDSVIKCQKFQSKWRTSCLVLCDATGDVKEISNSNNLVELVYKRLTEAGASVHLLHGGFHAFQNGFSHMCTKLKDPEDTSIMGLRNLQISGSEEEIDSADPPSPTGNSSPFPVEVVPHLFLGNAKNSADLECLYKNEIKYILNVTPNIPNTFEGEPEFRYMQIPINDHWSQNLSSFFPDAIAFIDDARHKKCGVLVHCLAGISRSVTVTVAYLMYTRHLSLNDAYDVVKKCKPNISPNFNFMGQLLDFERTLGTRRCSTCAGAGAGEGEDEDADAARVKVNSPEETDDSGNDVTQIDLLKVCHCKRDTKKFFSSPTCTSSSVSSTSSVSSSSSFAVSSASSNSAFDYDIPPTPS